MVGALTRTARALVVCVLGAVAVPAAALAQRAAGDTTVAAQRAGAAVVVRGDTLLVLSGTIGPFTADERARALARRVDSLAEDPLAKAVQVTVIDTSGITDIRLGSFIVMSVTDRDAEASGTPRTELAAQWASVIQEVIREREGAASLRSILLGFLFTLLATAVLVLLFMGMNRFFPWTYAKIESWRGTLIPAIRIQRLEVLSSARLTDAMIIAARVARVAAVIVVVYIYLPLVFSFFPWTQNLSDRLFGWVLDPLQNAGTAFVEYLPNLFSIAVIVAVVVYFLKFIHLIFAGLQRGAISLPGFYRDWAEPTYKIVRFVVIAFTAIMIWPYLPGSDTDAFKGISVFLGVLVSFGSASAIANIVAGVVLMYMRPFQLGDRVKIAETVGDVIEQTLLVTRVRTTKQVDITIPNAMVLSSHIINYNRTAKQGGVILHSGVTIGYDAPWRQVHDLLIAAANATEGVLEDPKPFVLQTSLDDFYVSYEINAYTDNPNAMQRIYSQLHQNIQDKFNEAGVEIMSPHYAALREGNQVTIPPEHLPKGYEPPPFRVQSIGDAIKKRLGVSGPDPRD